jgi:hypothetical protein
MHLQPMQTPMVTVIPTAMAMVTSTQMPTLIWTPTLILTLIPTLT